MNENKFEPCGVLIINKPEGITSHDVVGKIRKLYGTRKVGHTGTLDPLATGVLVILLGRAAKAAEYLVADKKTYRARLTLGITTDTEDITGKILSESDAIPTHKEVALACNKFLGKIKQIPPMYSALKVDGKKLYDLAREGIEIERKARDIEIFQLECTPTTKKNECELLVECSSGTYIRTLCADIGATLGCGGVMSALTGFAQADLVLITHIHSRSLKLLKWMNASHCLHLRKVFSSTFPQLNYPHFMKSSAVADAKYIKAR